LPMHSGRPAPSFFILGAQKSGTTWLWDMLKQHPGTSLPEEKEIHYFGSAELYEKGDDWYYSHFAGLNPEKLIGEASTTYFFDHVPFWHNPSHELAYSLSLPPIPDLIENKFPNAKYIVILRDPVRRAISAYSHWMRKGDLPPTIGLKQLASRRPKMRILEYGFYAKYLKVWKNRVPSERFRVVLFENQIKRNWDQTLYNIFHFLDLDPRFKPRTPNRAVHKSWGWTRIVLNYYTRRVSPRIAQTAALEIADRFDFLSRFAIKPADIEFLRSRYLPEKDEIAELIGNDLTCWDYGSGLLQ